MALLDLEAVPDPRRDAACTRWPPSQRGPTSWRSSHSTPRPTSAPYTPKGKLCLSMALLNGDEGQCHALHRRLKPNLKPALSLSQRRGAAGGTSCAFGVRAKNSTRLQSSSVTSCLGGFLFLSPRATAHGRAEAEGHEISGAFAAEAQVLQVSLHEVDGAHARHRGHPVQEKP